MEWPHLKSTYILNKNSIQSIFNKGGNKMSLSYIMARMQLLSGTHDDWTTGNKKDFIIMSNELAAEWETESDGYYSGFIGIKIGDG
jgi:hypothetical protein